MTSIVQEVPAVHVLPAQLLPAVLASVKSRLLTPCVTTLADPTVVLLAVKLKITGIVVLHGAGPPDKQTLMLPKLAVPKLALTFIAEFMVKVHWGLVPKLEQAPPQPRNEAPADGVAVSVIGVPDW